MSEDAEVIFTRDGVAGVITLNRPKALNALTLGMVRAIHPQLKAWAADDAVKLVVVEGAGEKAFCAGGDIRALHDWGKAGDREVIDFYREEYRLNVYIKNYPKPYIALMDGIDMGGGVGVSVNGSHRVATERLTFAMPETGIGLFPDVGGTYFLPRCPGEIGMFLGLTGERLKAADAVHAGIADIFVPAENLAALKDKLAAGEGVDAALKALSADAGAPPLAAHRTEIDKHFSKNSVAAIVASLEADGGEWASKVRATLAGKSPTSLLVAYRQIREGAKLSFEDCMKLEFRLTNRFMRGHDFYEGVRAIIIDKDQKPQWKPATLEAVAQAEVDAYFATLGSDELTFD
ncbi:MAG: enoyl-CoA hydratase/isomerase family protein [Parvibaculum sp.]|uniref:enoyl-CoA hydratase/isomerase family protein n=1 Tax=Parvibaculum sp. TaxID=2024848 RepID=UPI0025D21FAB|nr:enoyl-CoA hydratase/isomerase family protein [Parvibaculum sp.]MCE9648871.1 enoyl-CoA hydratase/isomerase family protein [Parvibaculum sp.]